MKYRFKNEANSWGIIARLLHWGVALLIISLLCVGFIMVDMVDSPEKFEVYGLHKAFGITVLSLVICRLIWRWVNITPSLLTQDLASRLSAPFLYLLMLIMPISGIVMSQAGGHTISFFGLFVIPTIIDKNLELGKVAWQIHGYTGKILVAVICLHILAALYHQFFLKNNLLRRMTKGY